MADAGRIIPIHKGDWTIHGTYEVLDQVYYAGSTYIAKNNMADSTIAPGTDTTNWVLSARGFESDTLSGITGTDTSGLLGTIGATVGSQALVDEIAERVSTELLPISNIVNTTTTTTSGKALDARQANPNETNSLAYKIKNHLMLDVKDFGAVGDGVNDDTSAIKAAIASIPNGGCIWVPNGTYLVTDTITLSNTTIILDGYSIIKAGANINVIRLKPNSSISGGTIDCTFTGFTSSAIYLDGSDQFGMTESPIKCCIENIKLVGHYSGNGINFYAPVTSGKSFIQGVFTNNVKVCMFSVGINLKAESVGATTTTPTWVNGNIFNNVWIEGCVSCIDINGDFMPYESTGNVFTNIQIQPYFYYTTVVLRCHGSLNSFDGFVWDWGTENQIIAFEIYGDKNIIKSNLSPTHTGYFVNRGTNNQFISNDNFKISLPTNNKNKSFSGDQDDYLFKANNRYTITCTPTNATINNAFNRNGSQYATFASGTHEIILDLSPFPLTNPQFFGLLFSNNKIASGISVELFYDGSYHTVFSILNNLESLIYFPITDISGVTAIRISLSSSSEIDLGRIFAQDSASYGKTFIEQGGDVVTGNLRFDIGKGTVYVDEATGTWYQLYVSGGLLKIRNL